jgi:hypothetical protein
MDAQGPLQFPWCHRRRRQRAHGRTHLRPGWRPLWNSMDRRLLLLCRRLRRRLQAGAPLPGERRWKRTILHAFQGGPDDGSIPIGGVVFGADGTLYRTTLSGGQNSQGTVFQLTPPVPPAKKWRSRIIANFKSGSDGAEPWGAWRSQMTAHCLAPQPAAGCGQRGDRLQGHASGRFVGRPQRAGQMDANEYSQVQRAARWP